MEEHHILREYQRYVIDEVSKSNKNLLIVLPVSAGKTRIASELRKIYNERGKVVVFIVPRINLIEQTKEEFGGGDFDIIWSNKTKINNNNCIIASKDTLINNTQLISKENVVLIFDEAQVGLEKSKLITDKIKPEKVLGLSATPERDNGESLLKGNDEIHKNGIFDDYIEAETVASLIEKGYLSKLRYLYKTNRWYSSH